MRKNIYQIERFEDKANNKQNEPAELASCGLHCGGMRVDGDVPESWPDRVDG